MRGPERPHSDQARPGIEHARDAVNLRSLESLLEGKGRQDGRHALGEHGLP